MKKHFFVSDYLPAICILLISAFIFVSCSKSNSQIQGYMKYKVDGVSENFDTCYVTLMGQFPNSTPPFYYCSIASGWYGNNGIIITFYNDNDITAKQYTEAFFSRTKLPAAILGGYKDSNDKLYISWQYGWPNYPVKLDIKEVSSTYIKGSFSGRMRMVSGTTEVDITEGEFVALIKR
ncbi:MAG: hypothetical protein JST63_15760 [Bacteroidetes bacterium]|nr:hypothetical protein [Bacteroidota bacterium]